MKYMTYLKVIAALLVLIILIMLHGFPSELAMDAVKIILSVVIILYTIVLFKKNDDK